MLFNLVALAAFTGAVFSAVPLAGRASSGITSNSPFPSFPLPLINVSADVISENGTRHVNGTPTKQPSFHFAPETSGYNDSYARDVPVMYDISQTQMPNGLASGSYWASSFITGSNGHQYVLIAHAFQSTPKSYFRGSLLDITTSAYSQFVSPGSVSTTPSQTFNVSIGDGGFNSHSADNVSLIQTWSTNPKVQFNLTFEATTAPLFDGAVGQFMWGPSPENEWGLPACKTTGELQVNGSIVTVDERQSFTWYDRQWTPGPASGRGFTGNWTWFELHFGTKGAMKVSVWAWDSSEPVGKVRFATIRQPNGDHTITPVTLLPSYERTYTSSATNNTYPLDWEIRSPGGERLSVSSHVADQEIVGSNALEVAYEGFVTVNGSIMGTTGSGYGIVEMVHL